MTALMSFPKYWQPRQWQEVFYFAYPAPKSSEQSLIIQSSQGVELLHGSYESFHGGSIHKVKGQQIIDAHSLGGIGEKPS